MNSDNDLDSMEVARHFKAGSSSRQDAASRVEVRIGDGRAALLALEKDWRMLVSRLPQPLFIHSFDWHWSYQEHLESCPEAIRYVSFFDQGEPVAIIPLRRVRKRVGSIPMWMWELPTHPHLVLGDVLVAPDWNAAVLIRLLFRALNQHTALPWDALHLPNLRDDSIAVSRQLTQAQPWTHQERVGRSMYFECNDLNEALAGCGRGFRRNLRRQGRKLAQQGKITLTLARAGNELDAAFADFLRLEASGWKGADGKLSAIALHPRLLSFYGELKQRFSAVDACLISLLKLDDVAVAAQFCLLSGGTLYVQKIAYDETWSAEAPGSQLLYLLLDYCCSDPDIRRLSLVTGPDWAVGRWNPSCQDICEIYVFKNSLRGFCGRTIRRFNRHVWKPAQAQWLRMAVAGHLLWRAS